MTTKKFIFSVAIMVLGNAASLPTSKTYAAAPPTNFSRAELDCGLGQTHSGLKACKAVKQLILFATHPVGEVDWVIDNATDALERARLEAVPQIVLAQMLLPSLIANALFADAVRHVVAIELSGIIPESFIEETKQVIKRAAAAGADVSDLEKRVLKETAPDCPANVVEPPS